MSIIKDESDNEFEFDTDFSVNSVHLDEFRRRKQHQDPTVLSQSQAAEQSSHSGGKFNRHRTYYEIESTFTPNQDDLENDFTDVSGFLPSELLDEADSGSFAINKKNIISKSWVVIVLLIVGFGAAILIKQIIAKNSANSLPGLNYHQPVSASEIKEYASPSDSTTSTMSFTDSTETEPTSPVYKMLKLGEKSDEVKKMQLRLKKLGYISQNSCTGYYGDYTENIIKLFQKKAGLKATGIADSKTLEVLYSDDAPTCY